MNWFKSTVGLVTTGLAVLAIVLAFLWLTQCSQNRQRAAQGKVDDAQHGALQNSAADAVNTAGGVASNQAASEELTRQNEREIRDAPGANDSVNPALRDAALRSLCRRAAYRNDQRCRVQQPHP